MRCKMKKKADFFFLTQRLKNRKYREAFFKLGNFLSLILRCVDFKPADWGTLGIEVLTIYMNVQLFHAF